MKTIHSIIIPTSIIFIIGSIITVSMDLKETTNNVYSRDMKSREQYYEVKRKSSNKNYKESIEGKFNVKLQKNKVNK